jgi:hypothetical protein
LADLVADMSDVVEVLSGRGRPKPSPRSLSHGNGSACRRSHCDHHGDGFHRLEDLGDQVVVPGLRGWRIRDRKLIDQEGTEIVRKLIGLALVAGIVVGIKKYLDNNPEAKRQVKEQANKAMGQAKHLAEEAGEKVKARTSQAQNQVDSFTGAATPGSTSSTSSATTPHDPATGAPTTL